MKILTLPALTFVLLLHLSVPHSLQAQTLPTAQFSAELVNPVILSPRSTVIIGHSSLLSPVSVALDGVLVRPTGTTNVFNEVIIQDGNGKILGTSDQTNAQGKFVVKFFTPFVIFPHTATDVVVLGRTRDDIWHAHLQNAGLQTDQFFYNGTMVDVEGQYPGGQLKVDASVYQRGRVVWNRESAPQSTVVFNPSRRGLLSIDRFVAKVEYEGVKIFPFAEIITTGKASPKNIQVDLFYGGGKRLRGAVTFIPEKNRGIIQFAKPLELPVGNHQIELRIRLGGTFQRRQSAIFVFDTNRMQALGTLSGYPIRVLSDLSPASNTVTSVKVSYSR